jgi:hypothetical protein
LIRQKLQCVVVCPHHKGVCLEVWLPVTHRFDQPNELPLIGGQFGVLRCDGAAVEGNGPFLCSMALKSVLDTSQLMMKVASKSSDQGLLEGIEDLVDSKISGEGLLQQLRERTGDQVVFHDEFTVVTREVEEAS